MGVQSRLGSTWREWGRGGGGEKEGRRRAGEGGEGREEAERRDSEVVE